MNRPFAPPSTTPATHLAGLIATALMLAAPHARAEEPSSSAGSSATDGVQSKVQVDRADDGNGGSRHRDSGIIPGMLLGPRLTVAVPTPTIGAEAKILRYVGASFDYGFFPKINIAGVGVSYSMWNVAARVYPFGDTFFIGAVYGHYGIEATATVTQGSGAVRASSNFLGPQIGARWIQPSGFFVGVEVAWAFALGYTSEATPDPTGTTQSVKQTADRFLQNGIPIVGLVSVGWFF